MIETTELQVAKTAVREASRILKKYFRQENVVDFKATYNLVSQADRESEKAIVEIIHRAFPSHEILGEEGQTGDISAEHLWIVDPLDGTNNFCHGLDHFAISIGYYRNGQPELGIIYRPMSDEWFIAARNQGAFHNGSRCHTAAFSQLNQSLIGTGFFYDRGLQMRQTLAAIQALFEQDIHGIRRMGTASLDLCMVGCGIFGGFFEFDLAPWDHAAGRLFVEEAGGIVSNCEGDSIPIAHTSMIAGCPALHPILLETIKPFFQKAANTA